MGFDAVKTEVVARLGNRTDIASRADVWINDAMYELLMNPRHSFHELDVLHENIFTTQPSIRTYDIVADIGFTDFWFVLDIRDRDNNRKLDQVHWQVLDRLARVNGISTRFVHYGSTIEFDPIPLTAVTMDIRYRRRPSTVGAGQDFPVSREWEEVLTVMAMIKGYEALQRPEDATNQRALLEQILGMRRDVPNLEDDNYETTITPVLQRWA